MKKFLSLLMALAMTLSLAACGGSDEPAPADNTDTPDAPLRPTPAPWPPAWRTAC